MAINNIRQDLKRILREYSKGTAAQHAAYAEMNKLVKLGKWHKVTINVKRFTDGMLIANKKGLAKAMGRPESEAEALLKQPQYFASWKECIEEEVAKFSTPYQHILKGDFTISSEYGLIMLLANSSSKAQYLFYIQPDNKDMDFTDFVKHFRDNVQNCWFKKSKTNLKTDTGVSGPYEISHSSTGGKRTKEGNWIDRKQGGIEAAHDRSVILAYLELSAQEVQASIPVNVQEFDLFGSILAEAKWVWREDTNLTKQPYSSTRAVGITPGDNPINPYEGAKAIRKLVGDKKRGKPGVLNKVLKSEKFKALDPQSAAHYKTSVPFAQQAARAAQYQLLREMMQKNKKHVAKKKISTKKPKNKKPTPKPLNVNLTSKAKNFHTSLPQKIIVAGPKGKEKGEGKETSTQDIRELTRLTKYINSRLGAEVRRQHGTDGMLGMRTGIFSRNVELLSLKPAPKTIVAKYTYMLTGGGISKNREGVYQTFENTGVKKWRLSYNPKNIITKSIRALAEEEIKKKFGKQLRFRRV